MGLWEIRSQYLSISRHCQILLCDDGIDRGIDALDGTLDIRVFHDFTSFARDQLLPAEEGKSHTLKLRRYAGWNVGQQGEMISWCFHTYAQIQKKT